jgi:hypothetical protein
VVAGLVTFESIVAPAEAAVPLPPVRAVVVQPFLCLDPGTESGVSCYVDDDCPTGLSCVTEGVCMPPPDCVDPWGGSCALVCAGACLASDAALDVAEETDGASL